MNQSIKNSAGMSRKELVQALIVYGQSRGYILLLNDFDEFPKRVLDAEVDWIAGGNSSSLVFQLGEKYTNSRRVRG
ncbi:MAG: hypothetical protein V1846_02630 [Candidatus Komeilibacteria bacterium]